MILPGLPYYKSGEASGSESMGANTKWGNLTKKAFYPHMLNHFYMPTP